MNIVGPEEEEQEEEAISDLSFFDLFVVSLFSMLSSASQHPMVRTSVGPNDAQPNSSIDEE